MKKLTTIGLTVMMIAMLLCSCDPSAVNENAKGAVVKSITLDFPSAYSMSAEASVVSAAFDTTQWNVANFDWYYKTSDTSGHESTNTGDPVSSWTLITKNGDDYTIDGSFFVEDSFDFTVIGIAHSNNPANTVSDPTILFEADPVSLVISKTTSDNVVKPTFGVTTNLTSGTDSKIELNLTFIPSDVIQTKLANSAATVKINGIVATSTTTSFTDGKIVSGKFTATLGACLSNGDVTVVVKQDIEEIVSITLPKKVYTYNGITTKIKATITGDDLTVDGVSFVPSFSADPNNPPFKFVAEAANTKISFAVKDAKSGWFTDNDYAAGTQDSYETAYNTQREGLYSGIMTNMEYRTVIEGEDSGWQNFENVEAVKTGIELPNENDELYLRAKAGATPVFYKEFDFAYEWKDGESDSADLPIYVRFSIEGKAKAEGNIMFLLDSTGKSLTVPANAFNCLFENCEGLSSIDNLALPATTLADSCYCNMFYNTSIESIPEGLLPATTLAYDCYDGMFAECTSLTDAPADLLPATTLADSCYYWMFGSCEVLTSAPNLPATQLIDSCYSSMFEDCTALTVAPTIAVSLSLNPETDTANNVLTQANAGGMFKGSGVTGYGSLNY